MRKQRILIRLSDNERVELEIIAKTGWHKARIMQRAQMLLWSSAGKTDAEIADLLSVTPMTVAKTRQRWVERKPFQNGGRVTSGISEVATRFVEQQGKAAPILRHSRFVG